MNRNQQSVQTNVSSAQNSAAPVGNEAVIQVQKLKEEITKLDLVIKRCNGRIKSLMREKNGMYSVIEDLRATLAKFHTRGSLMIKRGRLPNVVSERETFQQIQQHKNSAAEILYEQITSQFTKASQDLKKCGVVGIVATLGKVSDDNISRLLSEFLGKKTMLAVVCDTIKSAKDLLSCVDEGLINKNMGNHKLGEAIGQINEGFLVIILETLRPYVGEFIADDPQWRLDIPKPRLPGGEVPRGFLGFAVNMISIDGEKLFLFTPGGYGLRETLFYHLFSRMQVYRSKEDMLQALSCITDGAISLDGGIIRSNTSNDMFFVSCKGDPDIVFPKYYGPSCPPVDYMLLEAQMKDKELEQQVLLEELQREQAFLQKEKLKFHARSREYSYLEQMLQSVQVQVPAARQGDVDA